ncbi:SphA family protein [Paraflavitalea pollutisoli]|uniref:SphA family protein n=1 Tax=Paraflavitalea pollutisoli TaxID=3034143 RepID=UPI0023ED9D00|nr:transporter [Paraflavitalea sp. H1-2-19X]
MKHQLVGTGRQASVRHRNYTAYWLIVVGLLLFLPTNAQLKGTHVLGDMGLSAGTQAPPSIASAVVFYNYHTSKFVTGGGSKLTATSINLSLVGLGGSIVTNAKILGANYGASLLVAFASNKIEGNLISTKSSLAFTDIYAQPIQLGWKTKHADFIAGYGLYIPTGKYELGGDDNAGLGMWTNEISAGSTVHFDPKKEWSFAAMFSYALNSKKKNTGDNKVQAGNLLTIEGGAGKTWYKPVKGVPLPMIINAGLVYYMQFKTSSDKMTFPAIGNSQFDLANKDHVYGLGAEANIFIPKIRSSILVRWIGEMGASNRTQGNSFFITLAPYTKFLAPKKTK